MPSTPPPAKPRLSSTTKRLMRKRKEWRTRALYAALRLATWPAGKPGRDECAAEAEKSLNKVREWYRFPRSDGVINAIQRRAINAFRHQ